MLPLSGVRVVEFCQVLAGPYCGMLLADLGAEVIKVEPPEGDMMRQWPPISEGYSENFASINRNKRSVVLDLKDPAQKAAFLEAYRARVTALYPRREDGATLFPFPRLFIVARRY